MPTRKTFANGAVLTDTDLNTQFYGADGWMLESGTWTYASASTFTIPGDLTGIYTKGVRLKWTQTTVKYGVVLSSAFAAGTTTVTIAVNTDYTIANAAITLNYYSHAECPAGYPTWFAFTCTATGYSANPTNVSSRFAITGHRCLFAYGAATAGTSNATTHTLPLPVTAATRTNAAWNGTGEGVDNGTTLTVPILVYVVSAATVANLYTNFAAAGWTGSGSKRLVFGQVEYEI